jgi:DNA (cytosine-5)-methyltransferase 1
MFIGILPGYSFKWPTPSHGVGSGLKPFVTVGDALLGDLPELNSHEYAEEYSGPPTTEYQKLMRKGSKKLQNHQAPNHPKATIKRIASTKPGEPMYESYKQRIRLHKDNLSPTIVSGGIRPQFAYGHPTQPRGMSIRGGIVQGRVQTGDAVPPLLALAVASSIREALNKVTKDSSSDLGRVHIASIAKKLKKEADLQLDLGI